MQKLEKNSVDAVVSDPPYGLAFMGKSWDDFEPKEYQEFCWEWGEAALHCLKPGGHLLAFSGTRTYHRMVVGLEDAGFTIRDQIAWMYGNGFPKGKNISKAIDKRQRKRILLEEAPEELEEILPSNTYHDWFEAEHSPSDAWWDRIKDHIDRADEVSRDVVKWVEKAEGWFTSGEDYAETESATDAAKRWEGWNTSLKPAHEPVVVAQKPRDGTYAENVLEHGVGGLNIDACRVGVGDGGSREGEETQNARYTENGSTNIAATPGPRGGDSRGRWPPNVVLDEQSAAQLDRQSGNNRGAKAPVTGNEPSQNINGDVYGDYSMVQRGQEVYDSGGGAARFFYCAKARKSERNAGLDEDNDIATLKPINLMRWLVRLVTPEDGVVLDPFAGSGTTGCAVVIEGMDYILIEKRDRFANEIAPRRIDYWRKPEHWEELKDHNELPDQTEMRNGKIDEFVRV